MSTLGWVAVIVLAAAAGFGLGLLRSRSSGKVAEMQRERDTAREELGNYRREVDTHFERTAELFDKVTDDYRNLYDHLALSARQLGAIPGESSETPLARPEQRRLTAEEAPDVTASDAGDTAEDAGTKARPAPGKPGAEEARAKQPGSDESGPKEAGPEKSSPEAPGAEAGSEEPHPVPGEDTPAPEEETGRSGEDEETRDKEKRP